MLHIENELYSSAKGVLCSQGGDRPASVTLEIKSQNGNIKPNHKMIDASNDLYISVDMLNFHLDQDLTILKSIPFCDDNQDNYNMNSVDAIIACLRSVNFWSFDGIHLSGIRSDFKIRFNIISNGIPVLFQGSFVSTYASCG